MDAIMFFVVLAILYALLYFFDRFFKSCMHYPYDAFLKKSGLSVDLLRLRWHTNAFNRSVLRWGNAGSCTRSWLVKSFTVGVILTLSLLPIGLILLFITIFGGSSSSSQNNGSWSGSGGQVRVEILLPGVNLPLEEIGFYVATLLCSTVVHELGHAMAAILEDIPVTGFGFQLYFCLPLAYTEISSEHLNQLKWFRKLRILCGGVWHNFLFASFSYLLLSLTGIMSAPFYNLNENVIVTELSAKSPLSGGDSSERGLMLGNVISQINDCAVHSEDMWYSCLHRTLRHRSGYCVSSDFIRLNDESIEISHHGADGNLQCCDAKNLKLCCFEYIDDFSNDAPVEIPQHVCLHIRKTLEESYDYCSAEGVCEKGFCLRPLLKNGTSLFEFQRSNVQGKALPNVVYMGHPSDVTRTVRISPFVPKPTMQISPVWGDAYTLFMKYNVVFSMGLAFINAIPCYGFDGHHIINTIINSFLANRVADRQKRDVIAMIVTSIGTLLFGIAVLKVMWLSVFRNLF